MTKLFLTPAEAAAELGITKEMLLQSDAPRLRYGPRTIRFRHPRERWVRALSLGPAVAFGGVAARNWRVR